MNTLEKYFSSYSEYHKTPGNKRTHYLGIPMILFSTFGLFAALGVGWWNLGFALWVGGTIFYLRLDWKRAVPFSILTLALYWTSLWVPLWIHGMLFVGGWVLQGIGHYVYEKKSPAFLTNLSHLFVGPFWIYCRVVKPAKVSPGSVQGRS